MSRSAQMKAEIALQKRLKKNAAKRAKHSQLLTQEHKHQDERTGVLEYSRSTKVIPLARKGKKEDIPEEEEAMEETKDESADKKRMKPFRECQIVPSLADIQIAPLQIPRKPETEIAETQTSKLHEDARDRSDSLNQRESLIVSAPETRQTKQTEALMQTFNETAVFNEGQQALQYVANMDVKQLQSNEELLSRVRKLLNMLDEKQQAQTNSAAEQVNEEPPQPPQESLNQEDTMKDLNGLELSPIRGGASKAFDMSEDQRQLEEALAVVPEEASVAASSHYRQQDSIKEQMMNQE